MIEKYILKADHAADLTSHKNEIERLERERDEARDRADTMFANHVDILDQARRERDEAREQLDAERALADRLARTLKRWSNNDQANRDLAAWKEARK